MAIMPGHVKRGGTGEPDPDPTPFLFVSYEQKQKDLKRVSKPELAQTIYSYVDENNLTYVVELSESAQKISKNRFTKTCR